jgi:drug/metabolite transporter (DMT)-like permease
MALRALAELANRPSRRDGAAVSSAAISTLSTRRPLLGAGLLLVCAVLWGLAFVPQKHSVVALPPLTATALRFALAAPLMLLLARKQLRAPGFRARDAVLLGGVLYVAYALQTAALVLIPVVRVSLITGLYAVFVPLFAPWFGHQRPSGLHWTGAGLAFLGLLGLVGVLGGGDALRAPLSLGDLWTLLHAALGAVQVLIVGKLVRTADARALNAMQLVVLAGLAVPISLAFEGPWDMAIVLDRHVLLAVGYLAVFSTVIAFTTQLMGQKHASPPTAAVIMLLETPIGVLAAMVVFDERMLLAQWIGAAVLLLGVCVSLFAETRRAAALAGATPHDGQG